MSKMPNNLQELLKLRGVNDGDIEMVHDYYSDVLNEVAKGTIEEKEKQQAEAKKNEKPNVLELARETRIIK